MGLWVDQLQAAAREVAAHAPDRPCQPAHHSCTSSFSWRSHPPHNTDLRATRECALLAQFEFQYTIHRTRTIVVYIQPRARLAEGSCAEGQATAVRGRVRCAPPTELLSSSSAATTGDGCQTQVLALLEQWQGCLLCVVGAAGGPDHRGTPKRAGAGVLLLLLLLLLLRWS